MGRRPVSQKYEKLLLDTHVFLWVMSSPEKLSRRAAAAIDDADHLYISTITAWEIVMLARKRRIDIGERPADWVREAVASLELNPLPPSLDIAMESDLLEA